MGILDFFGLSRSQSAPSALSSPFATTSLQQIVISDIFGDIEFPLGRADAIAIPPVAKARQIVCSTIARLPLRTLNAEGELPEAQQPSWMYRTDGTVSPYLRMTWTIDDLLFYGDSLWVVDRGSEGQITRAERCPREWWQIDADGSIRVQNQPVNAKDVIYFTSHIEGLLTRGQTTLKAARAVDKAVERRASSPIPLVELHAIDSEVALTSTEVKELISSYVKARRDEHGAVLFTPSHIELRAHGDKADSGAQIEARNASRLDIANLVGLPAASLEGSLSTASLTYSTQEGQRQQLAELGLAPWIDTIQTRLSQDDVVPRGQRVRFDLSDLFTPTPAPTGPIEQD